MAETMRQVARLYREHGPDLLRYLRRRFADAGSAEDLLQETFVQAMRRPDRLGQAVSPRAWLFAIARNVGVSWLRRRRRPVRLPDEIASPVGAAEDPRLERMRRAIAALPAPQREALELRLREQLSYEEIADVLDVPLGTVRSRLHHAVRRLRGAIGDAPGEQAPPGRERPRM